MITAALVIILGLLVWLRMMTDDDRVDRRARHRRCLQNIARLEREIREMGEDDIDPQYVQVFTNAYGKENDG